jgi:hypothetical protein
LGGKPIATKVVRIYNGAGYFDDALAERLLPILVKAFPSARADTTQPAVAQTKPENQKKVATATHR